MATKKQRTPRGRTASDYAVENQRRQREWEFGFRQRIEWLIAQLGGPSKVQAAAHIKAQSLQKIRKGGSRLALFATLVDVCGVDPLWLLLGSHSVQPFRHAVVTAPAHRPGPLFVADREIDGVAAWPPAPPPTRAKPKTKKPGSRRSAPGR